MEHTGGGSAVAGKGEQHGRQWGDTTKGGKFDLLFREPDLKGAGVGAGEWYM